MNASEVLTSREASLIRSFTLEQAREAELVGLLSEPAMLVYCYVWRNSAVRFSSELDQFADSEIRAAYLNHGIDRAIIRACQRVSEELS